MTPYLVRRKAKGKAFTLALPIVLTFLMSGCHGSETRTPRIHINTLSYPALDTTASAHEYASEPCLNWSPSPHSASLFFTLSESITDRDYYHDFDTAPCKVTGTLEVNGQEWKFEINGAAKGLWVRGDEKRFFGCKRSECGPLVMWDYVPPEME